MKHPAQLEYAVGGLISPPEYKKTDYTVWWYDDQYAVLLYKESVIEYSPHDRLPDLVGEYVDNYQLTFLFRKDDINFYEVRDTA